VRAAAALSAEGYRVVVTGARGERELTAKVAGTHGLDLGGATDLRQLAGVLAGARVAVAGNTGPAHLAAAVGTPVVSLFAPVVPAERWRPYGVPHVLLGDQEAACAGSRARRCPSPGHSCLDGVSDAEVLAAVAALRDARPGGMNASDQARKTSRAEPGAVPWPGPRDVPDPGGGPEDVPDPGGGPETERGATV
jgi:ADP-heptose:LPS heptosyltransferase